MASPIQMLIATWSKAGFPFSDGGAGDGCCFLLLSSPADELLLLQGGCLVLLSC